MIIWIPPSNCVPADPHLGSHPLGVGGWCTPPPIVSSSGRAIQANHPSAGLGSGAPRFLVAVTCVVPCSIFGMRSPPASTHRKRSSVGRSLGMAGGHLALAGVAGGGPAAACVLFPSGMLPLHGHCVSALLLPVQPFTDKVWSATHGTTSSLLFVLTHNSTST